jgi:hypothetical protein
MTPPTRAIIRTSIPPITSPVFFPFGFPAGATGIVADSTGGSDATGGVVEDSGLGMADSGISVVVVVVVVVDVDGAGIAKASGVSSPIGVELGTGVGVTTGSGVGAGVGITDSAGLSAIGALGTAGSVAGVLGKGLKVGRSATGATGSGTAVFSSGVPRAASTIAWGFVIV